MIDGLVIFAKSFVISFGVFCSAYLLYDLVVTSGANVNILKTINYKNEIILREIQENKKERRYLLQYLNRKCDE